MGLPLEAFAGALPPPGTVAPALDRCAPPVLLPLVLTNSALGTGASVFEATAPTFASGFALGELGETALEEDAEAGLIAAMRMVIYYTNIT